MIAQEEFSEFHKEYNDKKGFVTIELSIKDIDAFEETIRNTEPKLLYGKWIIMQCDTCEEYHGKGYVHATIENEKALLEMEKSSNYIKTL